LGNTLPNLNNIINNVLGIKTIIGKNPFATSINEQPKIRKNAEFIIYPNPTNGILKIEWDTIK
jgi:hypothetical protein